jgi:UDP-N-acetylglucosamine--N-acetylmuramyl-(pentapeptide) pyrophosphoryl-undecaprenol N-acetylglucosamine transferase
VEARVPVTVVIAGGGTGGHTSPGLAVASALRGRGVDCAWIGSWGGIEARRAPAAGIPFYPIATGKLRRYWAWQNVLDLGVNVPVGILQAWRWLGRLAPEVVLATGGFVALPVVAAAAARRIPVVVHEQTAVPGLANRISARVASRIALTFPETAAHFPRARYAVTGNPLREELRRGSRERAFEHFGLDPAAPLIYVTGGALGARRINRVVGEALPELLEVTQVIHQCGANAASGDREWLDVRWAVLPESLRERYRVVPYVDAELGDVYAAARLVVGRAGAGTVNECCQLALPALYIPLPGARGDEQTANARLVEAAGGCVVLPDAALSARRLVGTIRDLLAASGRLKEMGEHAYGLARADAAERIVTLLLQTARLARR